MLWATLPGDSGGRALFPLLAAAFALGLAPPDAWSQPAAVLTGARLLGGSSASVEQLARSADGRLYAYGRAGSDGLPGLASGSYTNAGQWAVFVARIDPATLAHDWVVPVGRDSVAPPGAHFDDRVDAFALGADGLAYVVSYASSVRFPASGGTYTGWGGAKFVYRIDAAGSVTSYAGPLDPAIETVRAMAIDAQGNVHLSGHAARTLVTTPGLIGSAILGTAQSAPYLQKIAGATRTVAWSTFLGVPGARAAAPHPQSCRQPFLDEATGAYAMALGTDGSIWLAGQASPADLPATPGAADTLDTAYRDAFVMRVGASGAVGFVARFGGRDNDRATAIAIAPDGTATVAGKWLDNGSVWYGPRGGFQASITRQWSFSNPCEATVPTEAGFLLKVGAGGAQLGATAMIGAVGGDLAGWMAWPDPAPIRIAHDTAGNVFVAGTTDSGQSLPTQFPFVPDDALYQWGNRATRAFLLKVRVADLSLAWGSRFGARASHAGAMAVVPDGAGNVFVAGVAPGNDAFPVLNAAPGGRAHRHSSAFIARVHEAPVDLALAIAPPQPVAGAPVQLAATLADRAYTGTVEFHDRGVLLGTAPLASGSAILATAFAAGVHSITATVRGAGAWSGNATAPVLLVVQQP